MGEIFLFYARLAPHTVSVKVLHRHGGTQKPINSVPEITGEERGNFDGDQSRAGAARTHKESTIR